MFLRFSPVFMKNIWFCCCVRVPASLSGMTGSEFGRITFVFETICSADCELYFMMVRPLSRRLNSVD